MFTKHDHYRAACADCGAQAIEGGSRYTDHPDPLTITDDDLNTLEMTTPGWDVLELFDGKLLCSGCGDGRTPDVDRTEQRLRQALTPGSHYTFDCDQCGEPVYDGVRGCPLQLPEAFLDDLLTEGLRDEGWRIDGDSARCNDCAEADR